MIDRSLMTKGGSGDDSSCRFRLIEISDSDPDDRVIDWNQRAASFDIPMTKLEASISRENSSVTDIEDNHVIK